MSKTELWIVIILLSLFNCVCLIKIFDLERTLAPHTDEAVTEPARTQAVTDDLYIIRTAAERNGIEYGSENWYILRAIGKAENGPMGREFGIMNPEAHNLDTQAGWCAASIVKARQRWIDAGKPEDFITHMGRRYCPPDDHPLNKNWVTNVKYWKSKLTPLNP